MGRCQCEWQLPTSTASKDAPTFYINLKVLCKAYAWSGVLGLFKLSEKTNETWRVAVCNIVSNRSVGGMKKVNELS